MMWPSLHPGADSHGFVCIQIILLNCIIYKWNCTIKWFSGGARFNHLRGGQVQSAATGSTDHTQNNLFTICRCSLDQREQHFGGGQWLWRMAVPIDTRGNFWRICPIFPTENSMFLDREIFFYYILRRNQILVKRSHFHVLFFLQKFYFDFWVGGWILLYLLVTLLFSFTKNAALTVLLKGYDCSPMLYTFDGTNLKLHCKLVNQ